jgi:hypothetical protein
MHVLAKMHNIVTFSPRCCKSSASYYDKQSHYFFSHLDHYSDILNTLRPVMRGNPNCVVVIACFPYGARL